MKVEFKETNLTFGDVKVGEVFIFSSSKGYVMMKIKRVPKTNVNAVYLSDGDYAEFNDCTPIVRIIKNAVLVEKE